MRLSRSLALWAGAITTTHAWELKQFFSQGCSQQSTDPISGTGTRPCENFGTTPGSFSWEQQTDIQLIIFFEPNCGTGTPPQGFAESGCFNQEGPNGAASWQVSPCEGCA
jgi:hypothetical protein